MTSGRPRLDLPDSALLLQAHEDGNTLKEIASRFGCSESAIQWRVAAAKRERDRATVRTRKAGAGKFVLDRTPAKPTYEELEARIVELEAAANSEPLCLGCGKKGLAGELTLHLYCSQCTSEPAPEPTLELKDRSQRRPSRKSLDRLAKAWRRAALAGYEADREQDPEMQGLLAEEADEALVDAEKLETKVRGKKG